MVMELEVYDLNTEECVHEDVFVHCFMDGRDTDPKSGKGFVPPCACCVERRA